MKYNESPCNSKRYFNARSLLHTANTRQYDLLARVDVFVGGQAQILQGPRIWIKLWTNLSNQGKPLNIRLSIGTGDEGKLGRATLGNLLFLDT